jgi:hypothetical protein
MPERRHEHECFDLHAADLDQALAEVDLQLSARRRLEPRRRQRLRLQRLAIGLHGTLQCSPADRHALDVLVLQPAFSANRSWRTTSALPRCRMNLSRSQTSRPSSSFGRSGDWNGFTPPDAT